MRVADIPREVNFAKVTFESAAELKIADLPSLEADIEECRKSNKPSYGAYVIRQLDSEGIADCKSLVGRLAEMGLGTGTIDFTAEISGLHEDWGLPNQVTFHFEKEGSVEARLLLGSRYVNAPRDEISGEIDPLTILECAHHLFNDLPVIDPWLVTRPDRAIKAELKQGDGLIFDDSQLHAFMARSKRVSTAFYAERPKFA